MLTKEQILESIKNMPEDKFEDIDVLLERLVMLEKLENGEKNIVEGAVSTTAEAKQKLGRWL